MKIFNISFLALAVGSLLFFANCGGKGSEPTEKETKTNLLVNNSPWTLESISLPSVNATEASEWTNFKVTFSATSMTTSGHPTGATNVWPSGNWTGNDKMTEITRAADGIVMAVQTLTETSLKVSFTMPDSTQIGGRTSALGGGYTFTLKSSK